MSKEKITSAPPQSATHPLTGVVGLISMFGALGFFANSPHIAFNIQAIMTVLIVAFSMIMTEIFVFKAHRKASTGLDWSSFTFNPLRATYKLLGLVLTLVVTAGIFWLFPEYHKPMYDPAWDILEMGLPYLLILFCGYFILIDCVMKKPEDGYYQSGLFMTGQWKDIDWSVLRLHARTWGIKIFFIPLMLVFLAGNMGNLKNFFSQDWMHEYMAFAMMVFWFFLTVDLIFTLCGYIFAFRLIDTHERSSEPTVLGWVAALICYPPMNNLLSKSYVEHGSEYAWHHLTSPYPWLMMGWGVMILALYFIYTWATVAFGCRFSNLSHRGIITNGPYRYTKHPAYISKNLSWWVMCLPFLSMGSWEDCIRGSIMLLCLNGIYLVRAWTEERHLARDPVYRDYQDWIAKNGIFRWLPFKLHAKPLP